MACSNTLEFREANNILDWRNYKELSETLDIYGEGQDDMKANIKAKK